MSAGPIPLEFEASFEEACERRGGDRRARDRRAPRRTFDPLFALTLVNQIAPAEAPGGRGYDAAPRQLRAGVVVNVRA